MKTIIIPSLSSLTCILYCGTIWPTALVVCVMGTVWPTALAVCVMGTIWPTALAVCVMGTVWPTALAVFVMGTIWPTAVVVCVMGTTWPTAVAVCIRAPSDLFQLLFVLGHHLTYQDCWSWTMLDKPSSMTFVYALSPTVHVRITTVVYVMDAVWPNINLQIIAVLLLGFHKIWMKKPLKEVIV